MWYNQGMVNCVVFLFQDKEPLFLTPRDSPSRLTEKNGGFLFKR